MGRSLRKFKLREKHRIITWMKRETYTMVSLILLDKPITQTKKTLENIYLISN